MDGTKELFFLGGKLAERIEGYKSTITQLRAQLTEATERIATLEDIVNNKLADHLAVGDSLAWSLERIATLTADNAILRGALEVIARWPYSDGDSDHIEEAMADAARALTPSNEPERDAGEVGGLTCDKCGAKESAPFAPGDECKCGGNFREVGDAIPSDGG